MIVIMIMNMGLRKGSFKKETEALKANIVIRFFDKRKGHSFI